MMQNKLRKISFGAVVPAALLLMSVPAAFAQETPPTLSADAVREMVSKVEAAKKAAATPTADSINLDQVEPLSNITADQVELERQAEEAAARAAEEEKRREQEFNQDSYKRASEGLLPLSTDQIRSFMHKLEETQEAAVPPSAGMPKGLVKVVGLSLDPGVAPPQVNLAAGYVTTITMVDQTGRPWPILDVGVGGNFEVTPTKAGSHVIRVMPLTRFGDGNLSIMLKDMATPVIFRLVAGAKTFHMRFDARVPGLGPEAKIPLIDKGSRNTLVAGDKVITALLENAPPTSAKRLLIGGTDDRTKAWRISGKVYVRTPLTLLSPAWNASASSADGMTVYEVGEAPVLLLSDQGAMIRARLAQDESYD